jgi:hypothetical protein
MDLASLTLSDIPRMLEAKRLPPVESWNPQACGPSGIRIARDGSWFHDGGPIRREAMVQLFSTLLRREPDGRIVMVTPVEKLEVEVEDMPFLAMEMKSEGAGKRRRVAFKLNSGDAVIGGPAHAIRVEQAADGPRPSLEVRRGLEARIARPVYYELADIAIQEGADPPGLWSDGCFFPLVPQA